MRSRAKMKIKMMKEWIAPLWWVPEPGAPKEFDWSDYDAGVRVPHGMPNASQRPIFSSRRRRTLPPPAARPFSKGRKNLKPMRPGRPECIRT